MDSRQTGERLVSAGSCRRVHPQRIGSKMSRPRANPLFELEGHWIAAEHGSANLYHFWHDARTGRTRRSSLRTQDIEVAKRSLAELIVRGAPKNVDAPLSVVLENYFAEQTDGKPSESQTRNAGRVLLRYFGETALIAALTEDKQKEFAKTSLENGH